MPLPSSGQISIADIRNEAVTGGCYSSGGSYSLGALATALGIPTDPDAMSEFYSKSCPTTTTTTLPVYTVNLYARLGLTPSPLDVANLYTSEDNITYTFRGEISNTTCTLEASFTTTNNNIGVTYTSASFAEQGIRFNAVAGTTTCPSNASSYCYGQYAAALNNIGTNNIAVTAYVAKFGFFEECNGVIPN